MSHVRSILTDPRVRSVLWRDLVALGPKERARELLLPLPWLAASLLAAHHGWLLLALGASFIFFLTGLRLVHDAFHRNLGLAGAGHDVVLLAMSILMLGSMHAIRLTHLQHHRDCLGEDDVEAMSARHSALGAILLGPLFPLRLHLAALRLASARQMLWICTELALNCAWIGSIFGASRSGALQYHVVAMMLGQSLTAFFAVWTVHHDCDRWLFIARTLRHRLKAAATFNMFFHVEHHLYPRVPTCHLPELAERLDRVAPEITQKRVF